ncbi:MAG: ferredoxin [Candidatus Magnetomorum sp.]|nr:ferredoxin [Candidatus Magnetomorum sp.]
MNLVKTLAKQFVSRKQFSEKSCYCILCEVCQEVCPDVFLLNDLGFIEVVEMSEYPEDDVNQAIQNCPKDCIDWMEQ